MRSFAARATGLALLLIGATQALRPSTPPPRTKTALNAFTNPFAQRPDELQELEPYETAPLFGECRRKLAACIIVGFVDFGGVGNCRFTGQTWACFWTKISREMQGPMRGQAGARALPRTGLS